MRILIPAFLLATFLLGTANAQQTPMPTASAKMILKEQTNEIAPDITHEVRVIDSMLPPKGQTAWHTHPYPVIAVITRGTLVIEMEGLPTKTIKAGEAWMEPVNVRMRGHNPSDTEPVAGYLFQVSAPDQPFLKPAH